MTAHSPIIRTPINSLSFSLTLTLILFTFLTVGNFLHAQDPARVESKDPHTRIIQQSIALMEQSKWQQTLDLINPLIEQNKDTGIKKHGAKFATTYYYKGLCQLKLAQQKNKENKAAATELFTAAIQSLNQCFAVNPPNDATNIYRAKSLLLRGNAQQSLGKFQLAIDSYRLFLRERNSARDPYNLSDFNINLAICTWKKTSTLPGQKLQATQKAISLLQESLLYTGRNKPTPEAVLTAIATLTDITIQKPAQHADLIPNTLQRTRTISPSNLILPAESTETTKLYPILSKLILQTAQKNLPQTSLHLTTLIPGITKHTTELEIPAEIELDQKLPKISTKAIKDATAVALKARTITFQKSTPPKTTSTINLYTILVDSYPDTAQQPENLYNLARIAAQSTHPADATIAITRARQFLKTYPQHTLKTPTTTILLNTLYHNQQYQESLTLAEQTIAELKTKPFTTPPLPDPTDPTDPNAHALKDSASFIQAASHYYLGNYTTAAPLLSTHQTAYPDSPYQTDTAYLTAAVQNQLLHWDTSIPLLRKFIAENTPENNTTPEINPPSTYLPFAHFDIAYAHYSQRNLHTAILTLLPFTLDIPFVTTPYEDSQISPSAAILLGNTHLLLRQQDQAAEAYQTAIQLATDTGNNPAREEAYYLLIDLLGKPLWEGLTNHRLEETIPYFLHFLTQKNAQKSPYYTQILTSSITALERATRAAPNNADLPANLLSENLFIHNTTPNTPGIETALKTYLYYLRKDKTPTEKVLRILTEDLKTSPSAYHQSLLIAAQLETLEYANRRKTDTQTQTHINKLYQELISQFRPQDLDNFTLIKLADHLTKNNNLTEAASYYQTILDSNSNISRTEANLGLAIQLANTDDLTKKQTARTQLTEIINNPFTPPATLATAHYHIIKLLKQDENWPEIETNALAYLKYPREVKTHHTEILKLLATAYDKQEKLDSALSTYTHVWVKNLFTIQNSAPALDRACQLLWERNNPADPAVNEGKSDRQLAYETAYKYIRQTKGHFAERKKTLPATAIQTWGEIKTNATETYLKDPSVKAFFGQP